MSVDRKEVEAMARLAQLSVDTDEAERIATQMSRILEHADRLRSVPVESDAGEATGFGDGDGDGSAANPPSGPGPALRQTTVPDGLTRALAEFAPRFEDGFFVVPPPPGVVPDTDGAGDAEPPFGGASDG